MQCGKANLFWVCFDGGMRFIEFFSWLDDCFLFEFFWLNFASLWLTLLLFSSFYEAQKFWAKNFILGFQSCGCLALSFSLCWYGLVFIRSVEIGASCLLCGLSKSIWL